MVLAGLNEPPPLVTLQVTPALAESFATVAEKLWVAPPIMATGLVVMVTVIGFSVMVAEADFVVSVLLVAVSVTVAAVPHTDGAE
jgi:hypothetical protein